VKERDNGEGQKNEKRETKGKKRERRKREANVNNKPQMKDFAQISNQNVLLNQIVFELREAENANVCRTIQRSKSSPKVNVFYNRVRRWGSRSIDPGRAETATTTTTTTTTKK
jgi:hypothetical protein